MFLLFLVLIFPIVNASKVHHAGIIGAILDKSSRVGKEERVAMEIAIDDFYNRTNKRFLLQFEDSNYKEPVQASVAAKYLIDTVGASVILGPRTWEESSALANIGNMSNVPIISFSDAVPPWGSREWPFLVHGSFGQHEEMEAMAAVVKSWGWRRVIVVYEDRESFTRGITPYLSDSLRGVGTEICLFVPISPFASDSVLLHQFENIKQDYHRVFLVHTSLELGVKMFRTVKKMGMMEEGYVWIATNSIAGSIDSLSPSDTAVMGGVLGVRHYSNESGPRYDAFYWEFCKRFLKEHPEERNHEPGYIALHAYDMTWAVAQAIDNGKKNRKGTVLLNKIMLTDFDGLSGKVMFGDQSDYNNNNSYVFEIINVFGRKYKELGYWSQTVGFSGFSDERTVVNGTMEKLGAVFWPGGARSTPKGWSTSGDATALAATSSSRRWKIGAPNGTLFNLFVTVSYNPQTNESSVTGFSVDVFKALTLLLPYDLQYDLVPHEGTFDELVGRVYRKEFDAAIGAIATTAERYKFVDFSQPHGESGLKMVVPVKAHNEDRTWLFVKPFSKAMWLLTGAINIYNGFVIWIIERNHHVSDLQDSTFLHQIVTLLWMAITTLFSAQGDRIHSNLSKMATAVWIFMALVITQSYTANLSSMLTVPRLEPTLVDVEILRQGREMVGCTRKSFVRNYLTKVLKFEEKYIRNFTTHEDIARALKNKEIAAVFLEVPIARLFLSRYCKSFMEAGPTHQIGGYGFVFPKESPELPDINEALMQVIENGQLKELEDNMVASQKCVDPERSDSLSLGPGSFWGLFLLSGSISTVVLAIYLTSMYRGRLKWSYFAEHVNARGMMIVVIIKRWNSSIRPKFSRRVSDINLDSNPSHTSIEMTNHV
ncbi:glutamate receptor 2.8-like [Impatiens glandulifera]|uniref:glutamate receptor 2.8-like n=1 Tax=Impatiens glandulifera TaxID=253017 RepID=UPI001FB068DC|nr:glutamate receptor 2.8-like [Impatiens glandulifera]